MNGIFSNHAALMPLRAAVLVTAFIRFGVAADLGLAQTPPLPANPQNPSTQSPQAGVDPSSSVAPTILGGTTSVTPIQGTASIPSSSRPGSLRSAGQGLPGMQGGPPIKGSLGYQDPASGYMRPTALGNLLCDPLVDGVCD